MTQGLATCLGSCRSVQTRLASVLPGLATPCSSAHPCHPELQLLFRPQASPLITTPDPRLTGSLTPDLHRSCCSQPEPSHVATTPEDAWLPGSVPGRAPAAASSWHMWCSRSPPHFLAAFTPDPKPCQSSPEPGEPVAPLQEGREH